NRASIGVFDRVADGPGPEHRQHRPEDFLVDEPTAWRHIRDDRRLKKESPLVAEGCRPAAADQDFGSAAHRVVQLLLETSEYGAGMKWTHPAPRQDSRH